jgi:hypothetical protein
VIPASATTPRQRTKSTPKPPPSQPPAEDAPAVPRASIKEAIALKRAEAKKAQEAAALAKKAGGPWEGLLDALPDEFGKAPAEDELGRWSVRETIERAKMSGKTSFVPCSSLAVSLCLL